MADNLLAGAHLPFYNLRKTPLSVSGSAFSESLGRARSPEALCWGVGVSQFLSVVMMVTAVVLTVLFGVAAWRVSDGRDADITATIPHEAYGWMGKSRD